MSTACPAIAAALKAKGLSSAAFATQIGVSSQHADEILSGKAKLTQQEYGSIAAKLGISSTPGHAAKVVA